MVNMDTHDRTKMARIEYNLGQLACQLDDLEMGAENEADIVGVLHSAYESTYIAMMQLAHLRVKLEAEDAKLPTLGAKCTD
jgi:hypothetical protein